MISIIKNMPLIMSIAGVSLSATAAAVIGSQLEQKLQNMTATDSTMVVVSYDQLDALTTTQLQNLLNLCLAEGVQFKSLPIVGVMATVNQINHMAAMPGIRSVFANRSLEYYNAEARKITDVKKLQSSTFESNNGIKFTGKGDTAIVNDSSIDATLDDLEYGAKVVENVQGVTHAQALYLTAVDGMWIEGHVNAYAAVAGALGYDEQNTATVNNLNTFNDNANIIDDKKPEAFWLLFSPVGDPEIHIFNVDEDASWISAVSETLGNLVKLELEAPDGTIYFGNLTTPVMGSSTMQVSAPAQAGKWILSAFGITSLSGVQADPTGTKNGPGIPEYIEGDISVLTSGGYEGLNDIDGHPTENAIEFSVNVRLVDSSNDQFYRPDDELRRK